MRWVRSTAPDPVTSVVVDDDVVRVADRVKATDVAAADVAAAAPRALGPSPASGWCPRRTHRRMRRLRSAMAAISEATIVATAIRRAPPAAGAGAGAGGVGPAGGSSALTSGPGTSTGARWSSGRTMRAVPVVGRPAGSCPTVAVGPVATKTPSRYSTDSLICAPSSCVRWAETQHGPSASEARGSSAGAHGTEGGVGIIGAPVQDAGGRCAPGAAGAPPGFRALWPGLLS